jgi:hypothetical protein
MTFLSVQNQSYDKNLNTARKYRDMGRDNIYKTLSVASVMPSGLIQDLIDFLIQNRSYVYSNDKRLDAFKTRFSGHSLLTDIVNRLTVLRKDQSYSLIRFPSKTVALREAVDMTFVPIDLLQMKEIVPSSSKSLSLFSDLDDKLVINVTDITRASGELSDVTQFQYRIVRDFLSRSFYLSDGNVWMSPTLVRYVAKVYSMTMGGQLARQFSLAPAVQTFVQTVFCAFFVAKMTTPEVGPDFMRVHARHLGLHNLPEINQIIAFMHDTLGHPMPLSIEEVCQVIDAYDHTQLKTGTTSRINRPVLNMRFSSLFPENHVSVIALEYPPYFLFMILLVLSNVRIGLSFSMKNMNHVKEGHDVMDTLLKSPMFFNALR